MGVEYLLYRLAGGQLFENQFDGDARPDDDRFAHHDCGIGLDQVVSHRL